MSTIERHIWRYRRGSEREDVTDSIVVELPLEINVNGAPLVALMRTPGMDKELATGFCLTEKVIENASQIKLLKHCGRLEQASGRSKDDDAGNVVDMEVEEPGERARFLPAYLVRTGCGGADISAVEDYRKGEITSEIRVPEGAIYSMGEELTGRQEIFRGTGGTHGAGIFTTAGEAVVVAEDVGRHNALDKAVGWCALRGMPLQDKIMMLSGRISYEMALKTLRVGIPVLVSMAAPTSLGLRIADDAGQTVVGFSDGKRFNVYTHVRRITT